MTLKEELKQMRANHRAEIRAIKAETRQIEREGKRAAKQADKAIKTLEEIRDLRRKQLNTLNQIDKVYYDFNRWYENSQMSDAQFQESEMRWDGVGGETI